GRRSRAGVLRVCLGVARFRASHPGEPLTGPEAIGKISQGFWGIGQPPVVSRSGRKINPFQPRDPCGYSESMQG
ncbi:MAG: hypothetical protein ACM3VX_09950, partial [Bacteroidota bacterium]